jgi:hypothetical protein
MVFLNRELCWRQTGLRTDPLTMSSAFSKNRVGVLKATRRERETSRKESHMEPNKEKKGKMAARLNSDRSPPRGNQPTHMVRDSDLLTDSADGQATVDIFTASAFSPFA